MIVVQPQRLQYNFMFITTRSNKSIQMYTVLYSIQKDQKVIAKVGHSRLTSPSLVSNHMVKELTSESPSSYWIARSQRTWITQLWWTIGIVIWNLGGKSLNTLWIANKIQKTQNWSNVWKHEKNPQNYLFNIVSKQLIFQSSICGPIPKTPVEPGGAMPAVSYPVYRVMQILFDWSQTTMWWSILVYPYQSQDFVAKKSAQSDFGLKKKTSINLCWTKPLTIPSPNPFARLPGQASESTVDDLFFVHTFR